MRILMFGISPGFGGTEAVIYSMLEDFSSHQIDLDFITTFKKPLAREEWLCTMGSNILKLNLKKRGRYLAYKRDIAHFFKAHRAVYDAVWLNVQEPDFGDVLKLAAKNGIVKRIVVGHSSDFCDSSRLLRRISTCLQRVALNYYATHKIAVSPLSARFTYGKKSKAVVIRSGIDIERFRFIESDRRAARKSISAADDENIYICLGRLTKQKNISFALRVFSEILLSKPNSQLLIVGDGSEKYSLIEEANTLSISQKVAFLGSVENPSSYLAASDYYLFPSTAEGMGMSLIEAQCSGLPCFASDGPIPKEAKVSDLVHWLPLNIGPREWAKYILGIKPNAARENAYKPLVEAGLDHNAVAKKYIDLLLD